MGEVDEFMEEEISGQKILRLTKKKMSTSGRNFWTEDTVSNEEEDVTERERPNFSDATESMNADSGPAVVEKDEDAVKATETNDTVSDDVEKDIEGGDASKVAVMIQTEEASPEAWKTDDIFHVMDVAEKDTDIRQGKVITGVKNM